MSARIAIANGWNRADEITQDLLLSAIDIDRINLMMPGVLERHAAELLDDVGLALNVIARLVLFGATGTVKCFEHIGNNKEEAITLAGETVVDVLRDLAAPGRPD